MDAIFLLDNGARATFLQQLLQSLGCSYICLWSCLPEQPNCLRSIEGFYSEESNQMPSSSAGSLAQRLFNSYREQGFNVDNDHVPGLAFKNGLPYMELKELELQRRATAGAQLQFYREARIKTAIFMGCGAGEIELGMSNEPQVNVEMEMRKYCFPEDFSRSQPLPIREDLPFPTDQNRQSSSSSSLRSLSMDSPDCSPFLFNISSSTSYASTNPDQPPPPPKEAAGIDDPQTLMRPISTSPLHQAMQAFSQQIRNPQFPTPDTEDAAMTKAILAVLSSSSPPPPPSQPPPPPQNIPSNYPLSQKSSAFKRYRSGFSLAPYSSTPMAARVQKQNMLKRAIILLKTLSTMRFQEQVQGSRPTSTQLHHMMSERKRREKLNESFQALRSLLPPGTKKDKASVLTSTTEYLTSLKAQVAELSRRNESLEAQLLPEREAADFEVVGVSSNERLHVQVTQVAESTSEAQLVDLQVILRGECESLDLVIRLLEFLKRVNNVSLISVEAATRVVESNPVNRVMLRLKFEGGEWDEAAFQEAVRRVVADLAQ